MRPALTRHHKSLIAFPVVAALAALAFATTPAPAQAQHGPDTAAQIAHQREQARIERINHAATARLTAQAAQAAAKERRSAIETAKQTAEQAKAVAVASAPNVDPSQIAQLDQAVADLDTIVATTPAVQIETPEGGGATVTASAPSLPMPAPTATSQSPEPRSFAASLVHATPPAPAKDDVIAAVLTAPDEPVSVVVPTSATSGEATLADITTAVSGQSAEVVAAAAQVATLAAEVDATAQANIAAAQAAAEAAARAAEEARLAAEKAWKIDVVRNSPNGQVPDGVLCQVPTAPAEWLRCDAVDALMVLNAKYAAEHGGANLLVISSYRSYSAQVEMKRLRGAFAATPGTSNHGLGIAVDLDQFGTAEQWTAPNYQWMLSNGPAFGWNHPPVLGPGGGGPGEPWHWEYWG